MVSGTRKHVLITFGRSFLTLNLARQFAAAGHTVSTCDSLPITVSRFSNAVSSFHRVSPPKFKPQEYCREIAELVKSEDIDMVIPIHEETDILSMMAGLFPPTCELFLSPFEVEDMLHNKFSFQEALVERGFPTLKFKKLASAQDTVGLDFDTPFAIKQTYSRGSQKVYKAQPGESLDFLTYDETNPWIAQEWMEGDRYCTYSVCRDGEVFAHATYPVDYAIDGSSCLTFTQVDHQPILDWVQRFAKSVNFTGHMGLDFIDHPEKGLYTIECNPRGTSGIMMYTRQNRLDRAFFGENTEIISPPENRTRMIGVGMTLYGWRKSSRGGRSLRQFVRDFRAASDVIWDSEDRLPALMLIPAYMAILSHGFRYKVGLAEAFMHDHEWDGHKV
ncbi:carboxylate--amine ligase [Gordonia sihwensis]|uniref:ATP-grasp domain-containing protein n=1 Tax=Gordonia sihwensis TaxID=173559 RepID=UPI001C93190A|nr:ATP-grasp domain-containing protein [Gordonia sihwensis]MBY4568909.1 carboxylate--amine ligase [Gordonia sihwensis]